MVLTTELLDQLSQKAKESQNLRMNFDMRNSTEDQSQRMLNALEPGTKVPIHRHRETNEVVILLRGSAKEIFFDEYGRVTQEFLLRAGVEPSAMSIPKGIWHTIECLEPGTVLFECKDGPFVPRLPEDTMEVQP